jgi:hypothetical protein
MYWLIEDVDKIDVLTRMQLKEAYIEVVPFSYNVHPHLNEISCVYIKPLDGSKGYMVTLNHSESFSLTFDLIQKLLNSISTIYVLDKKEYLHYFNHFNCISIQKTITKYQTQAHKHFYGIKPTPKNINTIIPIVKHYESCEFNFEIIQPLMGLEVNTFFNTKAQVVFNIIESCGIKTDPTLYQQYFHRNTDGYTYTQYNLNTTTKRPSNKFGGINFAALNKDNGERECFIPHNDIFIEMDISAYHPTLLSNILGYSFPHPDIHQSFADMYGVDYQKSKEITFKQMYGGVWEQYKHLEFFQKMEVFTNELWSQFTSVGYIECPISNYKFVKDDLENMNPQKLLNYFLQNLETSTNILILWDILKIIRKTNIKLVLYTYDSFLFDVDTAEEYILDNIKKLFTRYNLQIKIKTGTNYGSLL